MSEQSDNVSEELARQRVAAAADRLMIEVLLWTHPNLASVRQTWNLLREDHLALDRLAATDGGEALAYWTHRLSTIERQG